MGPHLTFLPGESHSESVHPVFPVQVKTARVVLKRTPFPWLPLVNSPHRATVFIFPRRTSRLSSGQDSESWVYNTLLLLKGTVGQELIICPERAAWIHCWIILLSELSVSVPRTF